MNPVGDWTTQAEDPGVLYNALGAEMVNLRASAGDREAQWSLAGAYTRSLFSST
jgi:hypothetical protein